VRQSVKGRLLICAAEILVQQAHYARALQLAETADRLALQYADASLKGEAQTMLGLVRSLQQAPDLALTHQQRAAPLLMQSGDRRRYANLLLHMGKSYEQLHQWDKALDLQGEALRLFTELGDGWGSTISWTALGSVYYGAGKLEQALACHPWRKGPMHQQSNLRRWERSPGLPMAKVTRKLHSTIANGRGC